MTYIETLGVGLGYAGIFGDGNWWLALLAKSIGGTKGPELWKPTHGQWWQ